MSHMGLIRERRSRSHMIVHVRFAPKATVGDRTRALQGCAQNSRGTIAAMFQARPSKRHANFCRDIPGHGRPGGLRPSRPYERATHYFAAVSDGMFAITVRLGLGPEEIRRRQISFAVVRAETDFHRELHPGDVMSLESTVRTLGEKSATFHHRLKDMATSMQVRSPVTPDKFSRGDLAGPLDGIDRKR